MEKKEVSETREGVEWSISAADGFSFGCIRF